MFLHHDQVPLYLEKHIYAEFNLDMHPDYTSTPLRFHGAGGGCSHAHPGAMRDPTAQPYPEPLVGRHTRTILRVNDVAASSQLATKEHGALAEATLMPMHSGMMVV